MGAMIGSMACLLRQYVDFDVVRCGLRLAEDCHALRLLKQVAAQSLT